MTTTLCWNCSKPYPVEAAECPHCQAANANQDPGRAMREAASKVEFVGMSGDEEPMARYWINGGL